MGWVVDQGSASMKEYGMEYFVLLRLRQIPPENQRIQEPASLSSFQFHFLQQLTKVWCALFNSQQTEVLNHNFHPWSTLIISPKLLHRYLSSMGSWFHRSTAEFDVYSRPWPALSSFRLWTSRRSLILSWKPTLPYFVPEMAGFRRKTCSSFRFWTVQNTKNLAAEISQQIFQSQPHYNISHFSQSDRFGRVG